MIHTVLIINSDMVQQDLLANCLQNRLGYRIALTSSIAEGLNFCTRNAMGKPDLILLDCSAVDATAGSDAIKQLCTYAPLVALVKYGDYDTAKIALNAGAQDFLTKPVAMERLSVTFRNLLLLHDAEREIERLRRDPAHPVKNLEAPALRSVPVDSNVSLLGEDRNIRSMEDIEYETIRFAMQYYHGRMTEVARRLHIGRSTLYRKLSELHGKEQEAA